MVAPSCFKLGLLLSVGFGCWVLVFMDDWIGEVWIVFVLSHFGFSKLFWLGLLFVLGVLWWCFWSGGFFGVFDFLVVLLLGWLLCVVVWGFWCFFLLLYLCLICGMMLYILGL